MAKPISEKNKKNILNLSAAELDHSDKVFLLFFLTLKAPSKICSRRHSFFFYYYYYYFSEKTSLDISCESSAKQMIHMKCQDLFSLKKKKNK